MSDLLTAGDRLEIRNAIQDLKDTFFKVAITVRRYRVRKLARFNESKADNLAKTDVAMTGLYVPDKDDSGQADPRRQGVVDLSEGTIYLGYTECKAASPPLVDAQGVLDIISNKDSLVVDGVSLSIIGANLVGPDDTVFHLVKLHYKNEIKS